MDFPINIQNVTVYTLIRKNPKATAKGSPTTGAQLKKAIKPPHLRILDWYALIFSLVSFEYFSKLTKTPTIHTTPGCQSHEEFVRPYRNLLKTSRKNYISSAVMILLYNLEGKAVIPCIKRSKRPGDKHSGQIGLPGGRKDASDKDLWHTAIRECQE